VEITSVATKLLGLPEKISGHDARGSQHRWTILGNNHFKLYLYHFTGDTWGTGTDYPKWFISTGLAKWYAEETAQALEAFPDGEAWMLLIEKPSSRGQFLKE